MQTLTKKHTNKIWIPQSGENFEGVILGEPLAIGGESDVFFLEGTGSAKVIKLYRNGYQPPNPEEIAQLSHSNLCPILQTGSWKGRYYEVSPFYEEGNSKNIIDNKEEKLRILLKQVSEATHYLHQKGYLHRDIKPENILIEKNNPLISRLSDFGKTTQKGAATTALTLSVGTLAHTAPEAATGLISKASDYFSLGSTIHELWTGKNPMEGKDPKEQYFLAIKGNLEIDPSLPNHWKVLIYGLTDPDSKKRWNYKNIQKWLNTPVEEFGKAKKPIHLTQRTILNWAKLTAGVSALLFLGFIGIGHIVTQSEVSAKARKIEQVQEFKARFLLLEREFQNIDTEVWKKITQTASTLPEEIQTQVADSRSEVQIQVELGIQTIKTLTNYLEGTQILDQYSQTLFTEVNTRIKTIGDLTQAAQDSVSNAQNEIQRQNVKPIIRDESEEKIITTNARRENIPIVEYEMTIAAMKSPQKKAEAENHLNNIKALLLNINSAQEFQDPKTIKAYLDVLPDAQNRMEQLLKE